MSSNNQHFYQFKEFRLDIIERKLLRGSTSISLTPKVFDVLAVLVERGGHLVEKDELLRLVWEDAFVEEANVARVIHSLRKILGEDGENKFIETVPKKGYRFVAEVEKINVFVPSQNGFAVEAQTVLTKTNGNSLLPNGNGRIKTEKQNGSRTAELIDEVFFPKTVDAQMQGEHSGRRSGKLWVSGIVVIFTLLLTGIWFYDDVWLVKDTEDETKSIAVLPLKPIGGETRDPIYELGIAESLILKLSSAKDLTVRPLSATRKYLELDQNPTDAGREQQVDFILSSNYQISGGKIRVTSQLINIKTGSVEEVFKSEKNSSNVFLMQDALANEIGNTLLARFGKRENSMIARRGTSNEEAYRLYLQAAFIFDQWNKTEIGTAIEYLERAVKLDPNFAQAYVFLGYAYRFSPGKTFGAPPEQFLKSKEAIKKALALDENLADAHAVSGMLKSGYESDFAGAENDFRRALEMNSESPMAVALYANFLIISGRFDEAIVQNKKAMEIDPAAATHQINHGVILYYAHRYTEAVAHFKGLIEKDKNFSYAYFWLWLLYDLKNDEAQAFDWFIKYQTQIKTPPETVQIYQNTYQKSGWKGVMREMIVQDEKRIITDDYSGLLYGIACFHARLGNKEKAFEYLEKVYAERLSTITLIKVDPFLDSLHGDPRFEKLVSRVGLK